ncbi:hypothetical protein [Actinophytocola sp.]|uniref:hypothetical protein n=1 Tax=Actinophytocola sp. TaxID=1872138 RepID=UPI00389A33C4
MDDTRRAVLNRLDAVDEMADHADPAKVLPIARAELRHLAEGWRRLLNAHRADPTGRCETCRRGSRARRWPCQVWRAAHEQLVGEGVPDRRRTYPLRGNPFTRLSAR